MISLVPVNRLKNFLLRYILGYEIDTTAKIGLSVILAKKVVLESNTNIGHFNFIVAEDSIVMRKGSKINRFNYIKVIKEVLLDNGAHIAKYNKIIRNKALTNFGKLYLGENSIITVGHYLDLTDDVVIGANVVIGGIGTQFWTHGFDLQRNRVQGPIKIGDNCYIGSRSLINYGISVADNTVVGMGTNVSKSINEEYGFWISQHLLKKCDIQDLGRGRRTV